MTPSPERSARDCWFLSCYFAVILYSRCAHPSTMIYELGKRALYRHPPPQA
ncbi:Mv-ORF108 peptide [Maruca vitrata nucleopolyhedrovirus]|uniref:Mv-ORF108 peptide n=1 Tax=Maruca vitrata nucleopolyhedrovirus TaxID=1307954 RepID=A1YRH0_9ABAC|nr:Mv-ORF108 peptide [Maruca vitrata nucleopolyhedrovirus]ABM05424.1 Mv-ORF108 peptide [Maruca vitrata nucleopolyhedrovirus]